MGAGRAGGTAGSPLLAGQGHAHRRALVRRVDLLEDHPQLGRVVPEYGEWQLRELIDRWNRVLYRLRADAIEIVTIAPAWMPLDERDADE